MEADDGACVGCTRGNRCSSCRRRRMECTSSVPSDRDVISRVDDSTVSQSWEISNRVRETETERCRVNKGIPVVRGMPYIFIPCTHTYTASDHSTTPPLLLLLLLATMKKKTQNSWSPHLDSFPCRGECMHAPQDYMSIHTSPGKNCQRHAAIIREAGMV